MVCGNCHSVFHVIDKFISHTHFCTGDASNNSETIIDTSNNTVETLAFLLWSRTMLKTVRELLLVDRDLSDKILSSRVDSKWRSMSDSLKESWHTAASVLLKLGNFSKNIVEKSSPKLVQPESSKMTNKSPVVRERNKNSYHNVRNSKGMWTSKDDKPKKNIKLKCAPCSFVTNNIWKMERHKTTKKHLETVSDNVDMETNAAAESDVILNDEIEHFGIFEYDDEKEYLHASPCDIILKDTIYQV